MILFVLFFIAVLLLGAVIMFGYSLFNRDPAPTLEEVEKRENTSTVFSGSTIIAVIKMFLT